MSSSLIYGIHPVIELLRSGRPIDRLHLLRGRRDIRMAEVIRSAEEAGVGIQYEERGQLDRLAGTPKHQGVVAVIGVQSYLTLDALVDRVRSAGRPPFLVMLDEVEDPHNLGAVIRTAEAAGAQGVIIPERRAVGLTPVVIKASAGATSHLPVARVGNLVQAIDQLKTEKMWVIGLDAGATTLYTAMDWTVPVVLVAGSEGTGLRSLVQRHCDQLTSIPLLGKVDSLNVSVAVGVVLYEVVRQRLGGASPAA